MRWPLCVNASSASAAAALAPASEAPAAATSASSARGFAVTCALASLWKHRLRRSNSASNAATGSCG